MRSCVGCSGCGGWRVYVAVLLPCKSVLPAAALPLCPLVWVGVARLLLLLAWRGYWCGVGFLARSVRALLWAACGACGRVR